MIETIFVIAAAILVALIMLPLFHLVLLLIFCGFCNLLTYFENLNTRKNKKEVNPWR